MRILVSHLDQKVSSNSACSISYVFEYLFLRSLPSARTHLSDCPQPHFDPNAGYCLTVNIQVQDRART
ncbi:hypothetical protein AB1N83_002965 [Pleurotus pulmonarius]